MTIQPMITLYRKNEDENADEILRKLDELVLAYRVEELPEESEQACFIRDGQNKITPDNIENWLLKLEKELAWQRSLSGDGCFIDPDSGEIC